MNLKRVMLERIEQKSIKILVEGEPIFLKKTGGWHVIYPPVDMDSVENAIRQDGSVDWNRVKWNWTNLIFGGKKNAIMTAIIGIITLAAVFGAWQLIASYNSIVENPIFQECARQAGIIIQGS
jgi:hypothetical protein